MCTLDVKCYRSSMSDRQGPCVSEYSSLCSGILVTVMVIDKVFVKASA